MAKSTTSTTSSIKTVRYKFSGGFQGRDSTTTKDQRFVNIFPEKVEDRFLLVKRPGLDLAYQLTEGVGRGQFHFNGHIWSVVGNTLFKDSTNVLTLSTSTGLIGSTECTESGLSRMFFCDGTNGYVINTSNVITQITDVDFPSPHIATPVYIDGYVCIPRAASADIYNCDLENPYSWTASNYITSELFPDQVVGLARQNNLVVAFGQTGTEFFYDNGSQQPTGTPLAKYPSTFLQMGSCAPFAIGQNERFCFYIGESQSGGRAVWKLDGTTPTKVSDEAIGRILDYEGDAIVSATSLLIRLVGHFFFVICLTNRTLVYDIDEQLWHEWSSASYSTLSESQINGAVDNSIAINSDGTSIEFLVATEFKWSFATDIGNGNVYLLNKSSGAVAVFNRKTYKDITQVIQCEINTPIADFGSYKRKFMHRLSIVGDLAINNIFLTWSDDDYQTWSSQKIINMQSRPVLHRLGAFRRRAFHIYYTDNYPLRLEGIEFIYEEGQT